MNKLKRILKPSRKKVLIALLVLVLLALLLLILEKANITKFYTKDSSTSDETAKTTSTLPSAQDDFTGGDSREPGNTLNENDGSGSITDTGGTADEVDLSSPTTSQTGEITVYSPKANATIRSGYTVYGTSTLPKVSYRLIDSISGVVATGELSVVGGKFSGSLSFASNADEARLDFYSTKSDGTEFSNVSINLSLGQ